MQSLNIETVLEEIGLDAESLQELSDKMKSFGSPIDYVSCFFHYFPIGYYTGLEGRSGLPVIATGGTEAADKLVDMTRKIMVQHEVYVYFYEIGANLGAYAKKGIIAI